jgi:hypothetical protein
MQTTSPGRLALASIHRQGQYAREPVDRLLVSVMTVESRRTLTAPYTTEYRRARLFRSDSIILLILPTLEERSTAAQFNFRSQPVLLHFEHFKDTLRIAIISRIFPISAKVGAVFTAGTSNCMVSDGSDLMVKGQKYDTNKELYFGYRSL